MNIREYTDKIRSLGDRHYRLCYLLIALLNGIAAYGIFSSSGYPHRMEIYLLFIVAINLLIFGFFGLG